MAEGTVWQLLHGKARRYAPVSWYKKREVKTDGAEALTFLIQERRHPDLPWDGRRPCPVPTPTPGTSKKERERNLTEGNPRLLQREFPLWLQDHFLS